jgi:hypothetical protein
MTKTGLSIIAFVVILLFISTTSYAQRGCCSWHGGVNHCDSNTGRLVCNDNSYSPSCRCQSSTPINNDQNRSKTDQTNSSTIDDGSEITVTGLAYEEYFYEQPNYDESPDTDTIAGACLLKLDSTENIVLKDGKKIGVLDLVIPSQIALKCSEIQGHRIEISGIIESKETGHHHGDAIITINKYQPLR